MADGRYEWVNGVRCSEQIYDMVHRMADIGGSTVWQRWRVLLSALCSERGVELPQYSGFLSDTTVGLLLHAGVPEGAIFMVYSLAWDTNFDVEGYSLKNVKDPTTMHIDQ